MPAVTKVVFYDDMDWPGQVEAAEIVRVTVTRQPVDGGEAVTRRTELYLTGEHAAGLDRELDPWFERGHRQGSGPGAAGGPGRKRDKNYRVGPLPGSPERRLWKERLRRWSDGLGLVNPKDPARPAWMTTTGKHTYPGPLEDGFILHEEGREEEALAMVGKFRPEKAAA